MIINDEFSTPLIITIVTLAGSMLLIAAIYGCCHQRFSQKKDQVRWEGGWDRYPKTFLSQRHRQEVKIIDLAISAGGDILACPAGTTLAVAQGAPKRCGCSRGAGAALWGCRGGGKLRRKPGQGGAGGAGVR